MKVSRGKSVGTSFASACLITMLATGLTATAASSSIKPKRSSVKSVATDGVCYDEPFCHGNELPELTDQMSCLSGGGVSWYNLRALNCSTRGR